MNNKEQQQVQYLNFADSCDVSIEREHGLLHRLYVRTHTHTHTRTITIIIIQRRLERVMKVIKLYKML